MGCSWDGDSWTLGWESGHAFYLQAKGSWASDYRPTKARITFTGDAAIARVRIEGTGFTTLGYDDEYVSTREMDLDFTSDEDIYWLSFQKTGGNASPYPQFDLSIVEFLTGTAWRPAQWCFPTNSGLLSVKSFWTDDYRPGKVRISWSGNATYIQATLTDIPGNDFDTWTATANRQIHKIQWGHYDLMSITFAGDNTFCLTDIEFLEEPSESLPPSPPRIFPGEEPT